MFFPKPFLKFVIYPAVPVHTYSVQSYELRSTAVHVMSCFVAVSPIQNSTCNSERELLLLFSTPTHMPYCMVGCPACLARFLAPEKALVTPSSLLSSRICYPRVLSTAVPLFIRHKTKRCLGHKNELCPLAVSCRRVCEFVCSLHARTIQCAIADEGSLVDHPTACKRCHTQ